MFGEYEDSIAELAATSPSDLQRKEDWRRQAKALVTSFPKLVGRQSR